jgi:CheY-like chemotaxis protein
MPDDSAAFEGFEHQLREALAHLYDPGYVPQPLVCAVLGCEQKSPADGFPSLLIQAIRRLEPAPEAPPATRGHRLYAVLAQRYLNGCTQEEAAERLGITPRHLRREQQEAVHVLASRLRTQHNQTVAAPLSDFPVATGDWRQQVHQELRALQQSAPGVIANVSAALAGAVKAGRPLADHHGVQLVACAVHDPLVAAIHPSLLRQILVTLIEKLAPLMTGGKIEMRAWRSEADVVLEIAACPTPAQQAPDSALVDEILYAHSGSWTARVVAQELILEVRLAAAQKVPLLVVEDNAELVHFYRRFVANTQYEIVHAPEAESVFAAIAESSPAAIVLDVMLPDTDGWELMAQLQEDPATRAIPIIVCSVVRRAAIAGALNAAYYLPKPVRRQQFIQAIDQVLVQASTAALTAAARPATAC